MSLSSMPSRLAIALLCLALGGGAAAAADPPAAVQVLRGPEIDSYGRPIADPAASAVGSVDTKAGSVTVLRGAPSPTTSAEAADAAAPATELAEGPEYLGGYGWFPGGWFDGRAGRHGIGRRHRAVPHATLSSPIVPPINTAPSRFGGGIAPHSRGFGAFRGR